LLLKIGLCQSGFGLTTFHNVKARGYVIPKKIGPSTYIEAIDEILLQNLTLCMVTLVKLSENFRKWLLQRQKVCHHGYG
jgi:hypothetical protein